MTQLNLDSEEGQKILSQIQKLLNLAAKNSSEHEAASAATKAQELLTRYNLDTAALERNTGVRDGKREESLVKGGVYRFQRQLWKSVAQLNFCLYWTQEYNGRREDLGAEGTKAGRMRTMKRHRLIGRVVNVRSTMAMATYLEGAIERLAREKLQARGGDTKQLYSRWALSYREGMSDRLVERISERYHEQRDAEAKQARETAQAAAKAGRSGVSSGTALTIADVVESEREENRIFRYELEMGPGSWAKKLKDDAEWQAKWAKEEADREAAAVAWAAAHPEEVRAREEARRKDDEAWRKRQERNARRRIGRVSYGRAERPQDKGAYYAGRDVGDTIAIDPQVDSGRGRKIGGAS